MLEALRDQVAFDGNAAIAAVSQLLDDATRVSFEHADWLLAVVDGADAARVEFSLERCLLLFHQLMR